MSDLRIGEQRMMAALHTFGAVQPSGAAERRRLDALAKKGLAEIITGAGRTYKLTGAGAAWIARTKGLDSKAALADPIEAGKRTLDRGLGLADHEAA